MSKTVRVTYNADTLQTEITIDGQFFDTSRINGRPIDEWVYLQVFELSETATGLQRIVHKQEQPEYRVEYIITEECAPKAVTAKIFVIDDGDHCTMLLAEEY